MCCLPAHLGRDLLSSHISVGPEVVGQRGIHSHLVGRAQAASGIDHLECEALGVQACVLGYILHNVHQTCGQKCAP